MRFRLAAAIAAIAVATPVVAGQVSDSHRATAVIDGYLGVISDDLDNPGTDAVDAVGYLIGGDGFFNGWIDGDWAVQLDLNAEIAGPLEYLPGEGTYRTALAGAAHVAYRDPEQYAAALFGAVQQVTDTVDDDETGSLAYALIGAEAQAYLDDLTLYVQAGVALTEPGEPDGGASYRDYGTFGFVRGVLRYFLTDNLRLQAEATYGQGTVGYYSFGVPDYIGADVPVTLTMIRLQADYRPDDSDFSYFAAYEASLNSQEVSGVARSSLAQRVMVGVKLDMGAETLKTRDREGVTWDVPQITGAIAQGNPLDYCFIGDCFPDNVPLPP